MLVDGVKQKAWENVNVTPLLPSNPAYPPLVSASMTDPWFLSSAGCVERQMRRVADEPAAASVGFGCPTGNPQLNLLASVAYACFPVGVCEGQGKGATRG